MCTSPDSLLSPRPLGADTSRVGQVPGARAEEECADIARHTETVLYINFYTRPKPYGRSDPEKAEKSDGSLGDGCWTLLLLLLDIA